MRSRFSTAHMRSKALLLMPSLPLKVLYFVAMVLTVVFAMVAVVGGWPATLDLEELE